MAKKVFLSEEEMPKKWYNIQADMPTPVLPLINPGTGQPIPLDQFARIFPMSLVEQEVSKERWIDIPDEVLSAYTIWRPTPLCRAYNFEKLLNAPVKIYYKNEGGSPAGSHKTNTAVPQAFYHKMSGVKRIVSETGAGQWGSAMAFAGNLFGIQVKVYMVRVSYEQKPYRRLMMMTWGADCVASPTNTTEACRRVLAVDPNSPGSIAIAVSEALEEMASRDGTKRTVGSVLNYVMLHQTVMGLEAQKQMDKIGEYPDVVIGCAGAGSNLAGLSFPFVRDKIAGKKILIIAAEPSSCPTLTRGRFAYDSSSSEKGITLLPMHTLGHDFIPSPIHAGGLRFHGMAPLVSQLVLDGLIEPRSYHNLETFQAGVMWARSEGFIPAPETNHAIAAVIEVARQAKEEGKEKTILFNWTGHGLLDLAAYDDYLSGRLTDYALPQEEIERSLASIDGYPKPPRR
ncbi:MAG: TrpB-like pyridoxal phosphate-dependent enzyme [Deltaproteobacteria bacterium]|nr:TrpB-like pyridoxal phosphate-dependent enzyme [Deltaproteobacteria bacterium]